MAEKVTIRKWFWVWEFEKEEEWLNEMAMNGWVLDSVGFAVYHFVRCEPGEYTVRLEMRKYDQAYVDFVESTGAEFIDRMALWIYFRKKTEKGPFDLFSDIDSKISYMDRIGKFLMIVGGMNLIVGLFNTAGHRLGWLNLICATVLMYALGRIHGKKEALMKERQLHE
ncbi:MAG: DUF2812 domain-containing protein [Oscillospiraceae bacterium]|nr:DUF2812 domain-containing protein [Oscillospiraceae bacterium]